MNYNILGKTGIRVSEIGLGCEGFVDKDADFGKEFMDLAIAAGVNCIDIFSPNPDMQKSIGAALKGRRNGFVIQAHLCSVWRDGQYKRTRETGEVKAAFEIMMENLGTDYLDIGMIHYCDAVSDWKEILEGGVMDFAKELKASGRIKTIGLSSHNPEAALLAVESGLIDVLMFSVNPCYDLQPGGEDLEKLWADESYDKLMLNMDPERQRLYETCERLGVGITVMKAFGGGDLLKNESPAGKALTVCQCLHYALTRPAVASVMSGARTLDELRGSLHYTDASDAERDYASALASFPKFSWRGHCMYCGHCAPCPKGIDIAAVTKFLNLVLAQGQMPESVREHYAALPSKAGECIACAACEKRCPFEVKVRENMKKAAEVFGA